MLKKGKGMISTIGRVVSSIQPHRISLHGRKRFLANFSSKIEDNLSMDETTHYSRVPATYHKAWFYEKDSPYENWQLDLLVEKFVPDQLDKSNARFVDIGGGTGRFTGLLHNKLGLAQPSLCVDFSESMLAEASEIPGVDTLCMDGVSYAEQTKVDEFDRVLLKEVIHHFPEEKLNDFFTGIKRGLRKNGSCVVLTRPKVEIDYPFSARAVQVWQDNQPDATVYANAMTAAGLNNATVSIHSFPVKIALEYWLGMIRDRMWSTFSEDHFTEPELEEQIAEIRANAKPDKDGIIQFEERIVLVCCNK